MEGAAELSKTSNASNPTFNLEFRLREQTVGTNSLGSCGILLKTPARTEQVPISNIKTFFSSIWIGV